MLRSCCLFSNPRDRRQSEDSRLFFFAPLNYFEPMLGSSSFAPRHSMQASSALGLSSVQLVALGAFALLLRSLVAQNVFLLGTIYFRLVWYIVFEIPTHLFCPSLRRAQRCGNLKTNARNNNLKFECPRLIHFYLSRFAIYDSSMHWQYQSSAFSKSISFSESQPI